jgi:glycosyltransferase involved in cell wall biosynthesis
VLWYAREVLPHVRELLPGVTTFIVGADPPSSLRELASEDLVLSGYAPDMAPYFTTARASIAPLRYGAGVKGKINLAMSYGVPVVATTPAVEAMHLVHEVDVMIGDSPRDFAEALARVYRDERLWQQLSDGGRANVRAHFSRDVARTGLTDLLARTRSGSEALGNEQPAVSVA